MLRFKVRASVVVLAMLAISGTSAGKAPPKAAMPAKGTVAAWEQAGAEFGWIHINEFGGAPRWQAHVADSEDLPKGGSPFDRENPKAGYYAAVRFKEFPSGKVRSLPEAGLCLRLWLDGSGIKDEDLKDLVWLTQLQWLAVYRGEISDAGLPHLTKLRNLRRLELHGTRVTDEGMKELGKLKKLKMLGIGSTQVTDAGLGALAGLKQLELLDLADTAVSDSSLKTVSGFKAMRTLYLGGKAITDVGVEDLAGLSKLRYLKLANTKVTAGGIDRLQKALPEAKIGG